MKLSGSEVPRKRSLRELFLDGGNFIRMLMGPVRFARRMTPENSWHEGYAKYSRSRFFKAAASAFAGLLFAVCLARFLPTDSLRLAKGVQIAGAILGFSAAVGIPKPESWDEELPAERANEAGLAILTFTAFALACYGTIVGP